MNQHKDNVQQFFGQGTPYLQNKYGIRIRAEIVDTLLPKQAKLDILDIGCGNGDISRPYLYAGSRVTLLDMSEAMLKIAYEQIAPEWRGNASLFCEDFQSWYPSQQFDVILCIGVLAHVQNVEIALSHIRRLLKPKGHAIIQFTDQEKLLARLKMRLHKLRSSYNYQISQISHSEILALLSSNSLMLERHERYSLMLPLMGKLPDELLYEYEKLSWKNDYFSRFGTEVLMLVSKVEES